MSDRIFGTDEINPPYRFAGISEEGLIKLERIPENWHKTRETKEAMYMECKVGNKTWFYREIK